ncbi:hypothetical protein ACFRQM_47610 [Streptomyces sp. NPDC056831]|uniref:hypothetical protein n=1 Tax=Streptomyces sp. NPDC056831 TaxID=3345954 RepID=UPI0036947870
MSTKEGIERGDAQLHTVPQSNVGVLQTIANRPGARPFPAFHHLSISGLKAGRAEHFDQKMLLMAWSLWACSVPMVVPLRAAWA